ncbi:MAG: hypothetical protein WBV73_21610 [Phormidium sp.]
MNEDIKAFLADKYENLEQIERDLVNDEFDYSELIPKLQNLQQPKQQIQTLIIALQSENVTVVVSTRLFVPRNSTQTLNLLKKIKGAT